MFQSHKLLMLMSSGYFQDCLKNVTPFLSGTNFEFTTTTPPL
jgi:hypothetical protein